MKKTTLRPITVALILGVGFCASLPPVAYGQAVTPAVSDGAAATTPDQAQQTPAGKFIQDMGNHAIGIIANKSLNPLQRESQYHAILHDAFDLKTIGHFVIGRAYDQATPDQQQEYMKLFEQLVVKIYGDRLTFYSGEKFRVTAVRRESGKDMMVTSEIDHPGGAAPTSIEWRVRQEDGGKLAVIDVIVAGVSQSVTQRQEYSAVIQRDGGKIDGLLDQMRQQLQGSSPQQAPQQE